MATETAIHRSLEGVINATNADISAADTAKQLLSVIDFQNPDIWEHPFQIWLDTISPHEPNIQHKKAVQAAKLALAVTYLRSKCRRKASDSVSTVSPSELSLIWEVIHNALDSRFFKKCQVNRTHQGFLSLPFCRLTKPTGENDEFWTLHVWLPSSPRPDPKLAIHSHQSFGQSWVLGGEAEHATWATESTTHDQHLATTSTHAIYTLKPQSKTEVINTGGRVAISQSSREKYGRGDSFLVPSNTYHSTDVEYGTVLSTIFFHDASRGFVEEAGVTLGPTDGTEFKQDPNPELVPLSLLLDVVQSVRAWEILTDEAFSFAESNKWVEAMGYFEEAVMSCDEWRKHSKARGATQTRDFEGLDRYKEVAQILGEWTERMGIGIQCLDDKNSSGAIQMFEYAKDLCKPLYNFRIAAQCFLMASEKLKSAINSL